MTNIVCIYVLHSYEMAVRDICCITYVSVEVAFDELYTCGMIRTHKEKDGSDMPIIVRISPLFAVNIHQDILT